MAEVDRCGYKRPNGSKCRAYRTHLADGSRAKYCWKHMQQVGRANAHSTSSYILRSTLSAKVNAIANTDLLDLSQEITLLRAYLAEGIERLKDQDSLELFIEEANWVYEKISDLARVIESVVRMRNTTALTIAEIHHLQVAIGSIFTKYIPEDKLRDALEDLYHLTANERSPLKHRDAIINGQVQENALALPGKWSYIDDFFASQDG